MVEPDNLRDDNTMRMLFAYLITKATDTHTEYIILISSNGYVYTYIVCLVGGNEFDTLFNRRASEKCASNSMKAQIIVRML